jgi:hypothetical protein
MEMERSRLSRYRLDHSFLQGLDESFVLLRGAYRHADAVGNTPGNQGAHYYAVGLHALAHYVGIFFGFEVDEVGAGGDWAEIQF